MTSALAIRGLAPKPVVDIDPAFVCERDLILSDARGLPPITNRDELQAAVAVLVKLRALEKTVEASRKAIKAPVLALGKDIDQAAAEFLADVSPVASKISGHAATFEMMEARKAAAAAEAARLEQERLDSIERERLEAERQKVENAAKSAMSLEDLDRAEEERERVEAEAKRREEERLAAAVTAAPPAAPKVAGATFASVIQFEIVDLPALFAARPDLVELVPRRSAITAALKVTREIPGLRVWDEKQTRVRA